MKKYKISSEFAPNITKQKQIGALRYLFYKYQDGSLGKYILKHFDFY